MPLLAGEAGSEWSIPKGPATLDQLLAPSGTGHQYGPYSQKHLLGLNKRRTTWRLHSGTPELGAELILDKNTLSSQAGVPATWHQMWKSAGKHPTLSAPARGPRKACGGGCIGAQHPAWVVLGHACPVCPGRTVHAVLEQEQQQEKQDAGCREHPCPWRGGCGLQPACADINLCRRILPKNVPRTTVVLHGPTGESSGLVWASRAEAAAEAKAGDQKQPNASGLG